MDESQWLTEWNPKQLLDHLSHLRLPRKRRLFATACCRRIWDLMTDHRSRRAVEVAEGFADGHAKPAELASAHSEARLAMAEADAVVVRFPVPQRNSEWKRYRAAQAAASASAPRPAAVAFTAAADASYINSLRQVRGEFQSQADLIRDLFRPFRLVTLDTAWLTWNHGTVPAIARHVYDDRAFHDLPILADALEDAGCTNADLLEHCRGPGPHVRGCWAVDLLLGRQ